MNVAVAVNVLEPRDRAVLLDHERLDVYQLAADFHARAAGLLPARGFRVLRDQLERASLSIVLAIAEGAGRRAPADKRHFYTIARGSCTECAAILDVLLRRRLLDRLRHAQLHGWLVRLVQMLSRLAAPARP
jgi:four helix bundle protein